MNNYEIPVAFCEPVLLITTNELDSRGIGLH